MTETIDTRSNVGDQASGRPSEPAPDARSERLTGIEALVRILEEQATVDGRAGVTTGGFVSGYPGSPIGRIHDVLERRSADLATRRIIHSPGLNEELAATAVWGSQTVAETAGATVDGVYGMWYGKAPGVDRAADALRHGNLRGASAKGGVLVVAGDDPKPNATMFPSDSNLAFQAWGMPILFPAGAQETVDLGLHGYALSRACGLWVGLKMVTSVADGTGSVVAKNRPAPILPSILLDGTRFVPTLRVNDGGPPMQAAERDLHAARLKMAAEYIRTNGLNPVVVDPAVATVGIVASGTAYLELRQALSQLGLDEESLLRHGIRVKKVSAIYPIDPAEWHEFARGLDEIVVVEEKRPLLEGAIKDALYGQVDAPAVVGKRDSDGNEFLPPYGEIDAPLLARCIGRRLLERFDLPAAATFLDRERPQLTLLPLSTARSGFFCSGCPHNTSLKAPAGSAVAAGIGCHLLGLFAGRPEHGEMSGYTQMGGEGAQWIGMAPFTDTRHLFQNVGDGTFHHSAGLALRASVAAGTNITYKLLYNGTVGMTGGQDVRGAMSVPNLVRLLQAEGVRKIVVTTDEPGKYRRRDLPRGVRVHDRADIVKVQEELAAIPGVTVLIHDQGCAAEKRRIMKRSGTTPTKRIMINERVCEACGDCNAQSECLSVRPVDTEFGRKTSIHQSSCNFDYTCTSGDCPSFLEVETRKAGKKRSNAPEAPSVPSPTVVVPTDEFNVHMVGIGGTGVISVSQMIGSAATLEGRQVRSLDLTGSTIKAGPVVSQLQIHTGAVPPAAIGEGAADLFLAFDLLTAMTPASLAPAGADRTVAIASSSVVPTAAMAVDPSIPYPQLAELRPTLDGLTRAAKNVYLDAEAVTEALFGDHMATNSLLVGVAFQAGTLPLRAESIEAAIEQQGVAVEANIAAFRWGRAVVADPALGERLTSRPHGGGVLVGLPAELVASVGASGELARLLEIRIPDLVDYQGPAYARRYADAVRTVAEAERTLGGDLPLTEEIARSLHRLMAYKDEYEVARLHLLDSAREAVEAEFGEGAVVSWKLHPPILRYMGVQKKITLGPWFRPGFTALRAMRKVRGTAFDVFGYAHVRRVERALVAHGEDLAAAVAQGLTTANRDARRTLVETTGTVRGYEGIKLANVGRYLEALPAAAEDAGVALDVRTLGELAVQEG